MYKKEKYVGIGHWATVSSKHLPSDLGKNKTKTNFFCQVEARGKA